MNRILIAGVVLLFCIPTPALWSQSTPSQVTTEDKDRDDQGLSESSDSTSDRPASENATPGIVSREQRLADYLSGIKFVGQFTIDGKEMPPKTEEYIISKCEKLLEPDMYRLTARIIYGDIDTEVPLDVPILWAGRTPVISLDNFWIPAMGTFDARVMIHGNRYAGTWQHDQVGGHMFGKLVKLSEEEKQASGTSSEAKSSETPEDAGDSNTETDASAAP